MEHMIHGPICEPMGSGWSQHLLVTTADCCVLSCLLDPVIPIRSPSEQALASFLQVLMLSFHKQERVGRCWVLSCMTLEDNACRVSYTIVEGTSGQLPPFAFFVIQPAPCQPALGDPCLEVPKARFAFRPASSTPSLS